MNKASKRILTIIIIGVILFLILRPKLEHLFSEPTQALALTPTPTRKALTVDGLIVTPTSIDNQIFITGSILANESVNITSEISGKIEKIHFQEGQNINKGALLVEINDDELRAQLEKSKYNTKLYRDTEYRQRKLLQKEAISREEYEQSLTELKTSNADIKILEAQLAKTKIKAPFDGQIGLRLVSQGAYITPNQSITMLFNLDTAKIEFSIPGKYSGIMQRGKKINFTVDGTDSDFEGEVYAIEPQIDPTTRTLKMRAFTPNPGGLLLPGQFAKIQLILESLVDAIMVPTESVIPELNGHKVFVKSNGKVTSVKVEVGIRTARQIQITSGLNVSDTILTSGILQVRPGMLVNIRLPEEN